MQTGVNRGLLGVLVMLFEVSAVLYEKKWCEYNFEDFDGLWSETVLNLDTQITGYVRDKHTIE